MGAVLITTSHLINHLCRVHVRLSAASAGHDTISESSEIMDATPPPVSLYATRWKPFLAALFFAGGVVIALLFYFVWPTPPTAVHPEDYQEPVKTILFIAVLLFCATFALLGLYWTLTPRPLLLVSASGLVYRPFPLPTRTIHWEDVEHVTAGVARRSRPLMTDATVLTLWFTLKPPRLSAGSEQQPLRIDIYPENFSRRADDLVQVLRTYHDVQWLHADPGPAEGQRSKPNEAT
jgi:hypothetical protein